MNSDLEKINDVGDRARVILSEIVESYLNKGYLFHQKYQKIKLYFITVNC